MQQYDKIEDEMTRGFSRKVLDIMAKFAAALGPSTAKFMAVFIVAEKDGPMIMRMLDTDHVELASITVHRSDEDNKAFATSFDLDELIPFIRAVPTGRIVRATMRNPTRTPRGPFYQDIRLEGAGIWIDMRGDSSHAYDKPVIIPDYDTDIDITVQNIDLKPAFSLFNKDDVVCLRANDGENYYLVAEDVNRKFVETKGVILHGPRAVDPFRGGLHEWPRLKRTLKVFFQLGTRKGSTDWRIGWNKPLFISWAKDEVRVETAFAPRTRE